MIKKLPITGALLLVGGMMQGWAAPITYEIPATQEEFEAQWETVANDDTNTWEWQAGEGVPYAQITPLNLTTGSTRPSDAKNAAALIYSHAFDMKAGEVYYLQAFVQSADYNDDEYFYIVVGTDKDNLAPISTNTASFYVYRTRVQTEADFNLKPTDTSNDRIFTVPEDGMYYVGVSSNIAKGSFEAKKLMFKSLIIDKKIDCPQKVTNPKATADPQGELSVTLEWTWPTKTVDNHDITEPLSANIYRSTSNTKSDLYKPECLIATINDGVAGEKGSFIDNAENSLVPINEAGRYYYYVAPINSEGENGECTSAMMFNVKWVGEDNRVLNPIEGTGKVVGEGIELTYTNRYKGYNDGYLDPSKLYNKIERKKDDGEYVVIADHYVPVDPEIAEDGKAVVSFIDNNLDGLATYSYRIFSVYNGNESSALDLKNIVGGAALEIPYSEDFSESDSFKYFSTESTTTYNTWAKTSDYVKFSPGYSSYSETTATLFTPPIKLIAGNTYKITITAWGDPQSGGLSGSTGGSLWGGEDDDDEEVPDSYLLKFISGHSVKAAECTQYGAKAVTGTSSNKQTIEVYLAPDDTGIFYLGFTATSSNNKCVYIDDISIDATAVIPARVDDLTVTADATGENKATITFTVPSKSNAGVALNELSKILVKRYDEDQDEVEVYLKEDDIELGGTITIIDEVPEGGSYEYGVKCFIGDYDSVEAQSGSLWVGYDVPKAMSGLSLHLSLDETATPVITWDALSGTVKTLHGGYIDMENLKYRVYRIDAKNLDAERVLVGETGELELRDSELHESAYGEYRYGVAALNGPFEGKAGETSNKVNGGIVDINYEPDLTDDKVVESFEGRGFLADGGITWKNGGDSMIDENYSFLPTFRYTENETTGVKTTMTLSRGSAQYEELLEVYLCTVEIDKADLREEDVKRQAAATITGKDNMELIHTIPVQAMAASPEEVSVPVDIKQNGKYRLALRCASEYNSKLTVHTLKVEPFMNPATGIEEVAIEDIDLKARYFTLQGVEVKNPESGIYIRISDGKAKKVMIK